MRSNRTTQQRILVYEIVKGSGKHPSADDIYARAKTLMPNISLGTIYRNLRLLSEEGKIREVRFGAGPSRYDGILEAHEHFVCTACGMVFDIDSAHSIPRSLVGKTVTSYRLDYFGLCEACSAK